LDGWDDGWGIIPGQSYVSGYDFENGIVDHLVEPSAGGNSSTASTATTVTTADGREIPDDFYDDDFAPSKPPPPPPPTVVNITFVPSPSPSPSPVVDDGFITFRFMTGQSISIQVSSVWDPVGEAMDAVAKAFDQPDLRFQIDGARINPSTLTGDIHGDIDVFAEQTGGAPMDMDDGPANYELDPEYEELLRKKAEPKIKASLEKETIRGKTAVTTQISSIIGNNAKVTLPSLPPIESTHTLLAHTDTAV